MQTGRVMVLAVVLGCGACATTTAKPGTPKTAATVNAPKRVKLAVLKVESDQFPEVAQTLNSQLHDVHVKGVDDYFLSKVTMEVVQLSIECVEQTPTCWAMAGKSLGAQKMLFARITAGPTPKRGKKKDRVPAVAVAITLFDVDAGSTTEEAGKQYKNEAEATQGLTELVQQVSGQAVATPAPAGTTPVKAAKPTARATP